MPNDRNSLKAGIGAILGTRAVEDNAPHDDGIRLVSRGGRPPKGSSPAWGRQRNKTTSVVFDVAQHETLIRLSNRTGLSFKELMYVLINEGLKRYESGELEIQNNRLI